MSHRFASSFLCEPWNGRCDVAMWGRTTIPGCLCCPLVQSSNGVESGGLNYHCPCLLQHQGFSTGSYHHSQYFGFRGPEIVKRIFWEPMQGWWLLILPSKDIEKKESKQLSSWRIILISPLHRKDIISKKEQYTLRKGSWQSCTAIKYVAHFTVQQWKCHQQFVAGTWEPWYHG